MSDLSKKTEPSNRGNAINTDTSKSDVGYSLRKLFSSTLLYSSGQLSLKLIGFILVPVYTRILTPDDYGIIGYTTSLMQILGPFFGLAIVGSLPTLYHAYEGYERQRLISTSINFTFLYALLVAVLLTFLGQPIFTTISKDIAFNPFILLTIWTLFSMTLYWLPTGVFNMREQAGLYSIYTIGLALLGVGLNILFVVFLRMGAVGVLWAGLVTGLIGMLVVVVVVYRDYVPVFDWKKLRELFSLALPALPHQLGGNLWRFADRLFLAGMVGLASTGLYSLAFTIASITFVLLGSITTAFNPIFYSRAHKQDPKLKQDWARLCSLFIFGAAMISLTLAIMGSEVIQILTPPAYYDAIELVPPLVLSQAFLATTALLSPCIAYARKTWAYAAASLPAGAVTLTLNFFLIPHFGGHGAAWAVVTGTIINFLVIYYFAQRFFPVRYEYGRIGKVIVLALLLFAIAQLPVFKNFYFGLFVKPILILVLPASLFLLGFFEEREITSARNFLKSVQNRFGF